MTKRGKFLTLEGVDGAGKSTHCEWLISQLQLHDIDVVFTREPGGTPLGESIREMLLHQSMDLKTETLLVFAARQAHCEQVIEPALAQGKWVLCDRFTDATYAYQGGGRGVLTQDIAWLERWTAGHLKIDRTWLFDLPLEIARERLLRNRDLDRFEQEGQVFFEKTRAAYMSRVQADPQRFNIIDSSESIEHIQRHLKRDLEMLIQS